MKLKLNDPLHGQEDPYALYLDTYVFFPEPGKKSALKRRSYDPYNSQYHFRPRWCARCRQWTTYLQEWRAHSDHWKPRELSPVESALATKAELEIAPLRRAKEEYDRALARAERYAKGGVGRCPVCRQDAPVAEGIILSHAKDYETTCYAGQGHPPEPYVAPFPRPLTELPPPDPVKPSPPWDIPPPGTSRAGPVSSRAAIWWLAVVLVAVVAIVFWALSSS